MFSFMARSSSLSSSSVSYREMRRLILASDFLSQMMEAQCYSMPSPSPAPSTSPSYLLLSAYMNYYKLYETEIIVNRMIVRMESGGTGGNSDCEPQLCEDGHECGSIVVFGVESHFLYSQQSQLIESQHDQYVCCIPAFRLSQQILPSNQMQSIQGYDLQGICIGVWWQCEMHIFSIHYCCLLYSPSSHLRPQLLQRQTYCCSPATTLQDFLGVGGAHVAQDGEPTATSAIFGGSVMQGEYERAEKTFHLCTLSQLGYPQFLTTHVLQLLQFFVDFQQSSPLGEVVEFLLSFLCLNTLLDVPRVLLTNDYLLNRTYFLHKVLHKIVDGGMVWQMNTSCLLNDSQVFSQVLLKVFLGFFLAITLYFAEEVPVCSHMLRYGSTATSICCCQLVIDHAFCLLEAVDQSSFPSGIVLLHLVNGANWVQEIICSGSFRKQCLFGRHIAQLFYRMHPSITPEVSFFITKQSFLLLAVRIEAEVERQLAIHDWDWQSLSYYQLLAYKNTVAVVSINHSTMYRLRLSSSGTSCLLRRRLASSGYVLAQSRLSRLSLRRGGVALGGVGGSRLVLFLLLSSQAAFCFSEIMFQDSFMLCAFSLDRANALFFFSSIYLLCFSSSPQLSEPSAPPTCSPICRSCVWQRYSMRSAAVEFWMHCCWICGMLAFVVQKRQIRMHFWI